MYLTFHCPRCSAFNRSETLTPQSELNCERCDWSKSLNLEAASTSGFSEAPQDCLRCGNPDLWRQKNFPQWAGFLCVATGAITSSIAWGMHRPVLALGILMGFALLDMILYMVMPDVLVCYRCQSRHHATDVSRHSGFNHELAERYRQERIRQERAGLPSLNNSESDTNSSISERSESPLG